MKKHLTALAVGVVATLALGGCASGEQTLGGGEAGSAGDTVVIGSADFLESRLIATIYSVALEQAGVPVREQFNIGSREVYMTALQDGSIDLIPEYSGALLRHLDPQSQATTKEDVASGLSAAVPESLALLDASSAEDKDTVTVTKTTADRLGLTSISDLGPHAATLKLGGPPEWQTRANGVPGLTSVYGLTFSEFVVLDAGGPLTLSALTGGQIDAGNMFSTDPAIEANNLVVLQDDRSLFPAEQVVPVIVKAKTNDTIATTLNAIQAALTTEALMAMNGKVAAGTDPRVVATEWLASVGR